MKKLILLIILLSSCTAHDERMRNIEAKEAELRYLESLYRVRDNIESKKTLDSLIKRQEDILNNLK